MAQKRGSSHTTLTETAREIVNILEPLVGVKMIAPGIITQNKSGNARKRFITISMTTAGFELLITGQGVQKVAVHVEKTNTAQIIKTLRSHKKLKNFEFKERERKPGI